MTPAARRPSDGGLRIVLLIGAIVSVAIGVWALVWSGMLETVLGFDVPRRGGLTRFLGGVMLAVGVGYALAAAQPHRSRSLLVLLFVVPFMNGITTIAGVSRGEVQGPKGIAFAVLNFAYCLFFFRMYPRVAPEPPGPKLPPQQPEGKPTPR